MYRKARAEVAVSLNAPWVLDLSLRFADFGPAGPGIAMTQFTSIHGGPSTDDDTPTAVWYNARFLPYMEEDEIQYGLFHELTHAALPFSAAHGPRFVDAASYTTGVTAPFVQIRRAREVPTLTNIVAEILGERLPEPEWTLDNPPTTADLVAQGWDPDALD